MRAVHGPGSVVGGPHAATRVLGFLETSDSCHHPVSSNVSSAADGFQSMTSNPVRHTSSVAKFVVTVGPDNSFPLPPSPLIDKKSFTLDSSEPQNRSLLYHPPLSSRSSIVLPQIGLVYEAERPVSSDWPSGHNADDTSANRTPSPMLPKDSPSSSNRSSTSSSNSSGYLGSNSQVNHPFPPGKQCRSSGHSSESGLSSIASSRYSYLSGSSSSQSSLDNPEESGGGGGVGGGGGTHSSSAYVSESFHRGLEETEVLYAWLNDLHLTDCFALFVEAGYDMPTISRMTPEDLTAIGITQPTIRKRLTSEISRLHISDGIPNHRPNNLLEWLQCIGLVEYYAILAKDGYENLDRVLDIIWEDLEEIGIRKLGHQKKIMLAIDRLKKLRLSMQRLSSVDQYTAAMERPFNPAKSNASSCLTTSLTTTTTTTTSSSSTTTTFVAPQQRLLRRSFSGENVAAMPRVKNVSRLASHPPLVTSSSASSSSSSVPQPEMVIIQVNNASRSWTTAGNSAAAADDDEDSPTTAVTYESFYGNPLLDFHCLRKEADGGGGGGGGDTTPTNEKAASSEELDRAKGSPRVAGVRFRPPLLAPKPKLNCRARRASGGSSSLYSEKTVFTACDWNSSSSISSSSPRSQIIDTTKGVLASSSSSSSSSSSGGRELLFARPTSSSTVSLLSSPAARSAAPSTGRAHGAKIMPAKPAVPPPPPPKRTNSVVKGESLSSAVDSDRAIAEETNQSPGSLRRVKVAGRWEATATELSTCVDSNAKSQPPGIALKTGEVAVASPLKQRVCPANISQSRESNAPSGSGSPDCNTLPFANENIGTIRQKPSIGFPPLTKVLNEATPLGALGRDRSRHFSDTSEKTTKPDPVGRKPTRPVPKQKPKFTGSKESKTPKTSVVESSDATDKSDDDVFNDIDNLFHGLTQELDQMLTFQD